MDVIQTVAQMVVGGDDVKTVHIGGDHPFALIAGPCVIESRDGLHRICEGVAEICEDLGIPLIFKASFDKANRSSIESYRGPGLNEGLALLSEVRQKYRLPITTDIHLPEHARPAGEVIDLIQIPAFLCRQTDLLVAAAKTNRPINLKKGQFLGPSEMSSAVGKLTTSGANSVMLTERGSSFGYNNLVVDMRSLPEVRRLGIPVCFDATHSVQKPGAMGGSSGGDSSMVPYLARAAMGVGVDALFMEVHDSPEDALSDGPNMVRLSELRSLLCQLVAVDRVVKGKH